MKRRVLIIDDDPQLNKINEKILLSSGIVSELHITGNGLEGLEYLKSRAEKNYPMPHIVIFDLDMPVMNGFGFIDEFSRLDIPGKAGIELVVFTGSSNPGDKQRAIKKGIRHYLSKPYLLRGLRDIVAHLDGEHCGRYDNQRMFGLEQSVL